MSTDVSVTKSSPKKEIIQKKEDEQYFKEQFTTTASSNFSIDKNKIDKNLHINENIKEELIFEDKLNLNCLADEECLQNQSTGSDSSNTTTNEVENIKSHNFNNGNCDNKLDEICCNEDEERKTSHDSSSDVTLCDDNTNLINNTSLMNNVSNTHYLDNSYDEDDEGFDALEPPEYLISGIEEASSTTTDEVCSTISGGDEPIVSFFKLNL